MHLLGDVKAALRVDGAEHDTEITDLIEAAKSDLVLTGINPSKVVDTDPLIKRAVISYVRANFEWDHPNAQRLQEAYEMLKAHLSLSADYRVPGKGEG